MQIDMHFYATYAIARAAGLPPDVAQTVATSAQFVDDAVDKHPGSVGGESFIVPVVSAHKMVEVANVQPWDQWQVWVPFHFLPGGQGLAVEERLLCRKGAADNESANRVLALAEQKLAEPYGWHLLGVVTHVIQDTFSHWGFSGISSCYNHVEQGDIQLHLAKNPDLFDAISADAAQIWERWTGSFAEEFSALGHGSVATYPDRPYLIWEFDYERSLASCPRKENTLHSSRDNPLDFLESCQRLYEAYAGAATAQFNAAPAPFDAISSTVLGILKTEDRQPGRISAWQNAIATDTLFTTRPEDKVLRYDEKCWVPGSLRTKTKSQKQEAQLFFKASRNYRCFVLGQLLPELGLL